MLQDWYQSHSRPIKMYDTFIGDVCAKTAPSPAGRYVFVYFLYMQIFFTNCLDNSVFRTGSKLCGTDLS